MKDMKTHLFTGRYAGVEQIRGMSSAILLFLALMPN